MENFILGLLSVIGFLACLLLMVAILLQEPKGGGIASALGGAGMETVGINTGKVNSFTGWVAGIWIGACLIHALMMGPSVRPDVESPTDGDGTSVTAPPSDDGGTGGSDEPK